jgi:hypothetical protein
MEGLDILVSHVWLGQQMVFVFVASPMVTNFDRTDATSAFRASQVLHVIVDCSSSRIAHS